MKDSSPYWLIIRILWPLAGGAWFAWVGAQSVLRDLNHMNHDSFGGMILLGFDGFIALISMIIGMAIGGAIGGVTEWLLRRIGVGIAGAIIAASLMSLLGTWQLAAFIQQELPGFQTFVKEKPLQKSRLPYKPDAKGRNQFCFEPRPKDHTGAIWDSECDHSKPSQSFCSTPRPTDHTGGIVWDSECR